MSILIFGFIIRFILPSFFPFKSIAIVMKMMILLQRVYFCSHCQCGRKRKRWRIFKQASAIIYTHLDKTKRNVMDGRASSLQSSYTKSLISSSLASLHLFHKNDLISQRVREEREQKHHCIFMHASLVPT